MIARHARPKGQPRRSWAPLDPDFPRTLPEFVRDPLPLSEAEVQALRDQFGDEAARAAARPPRSPGGVPMKTAAIAILAAAVALVVGAASGSLSASEPVARTPHVCLTALTRAADMDELQGELLHQVRLRGDALGKDDYQELDAEVVRVLDEMEPAEASYASAEAQCRGLA
ncbi:hypothetical protein [Promicromonospora iranensis]|uniref:Uncharacterized protein n=1 Tax=Promicromonospora iranensis TaxID=1105144 RepID=A0ABU2CV84_9MICO|nr:hypothetical protein [Promicromonospora iranensis]MDR7385251.1 hypothetical protein [Promicromonospora iranensis]